METVISPSIHTFLTNSPENIGKEPKMGSIIEVNTVSSHDEGYFSNGIATPTYAIPDRVHSDKDKIRVVCVGAGASGLCLAYKMERAMSDYELVCYEKNPKIGGTWYENRYPGVACDIPAHCYTFSFEPNPTWSTFYAYGPEIQKYFEGFHDKYNLAKYIKLNSKVESAVWDENKGIYDLLINTPEGTIHDYCHVLINGSGVLNRWKWPKIEGLHSFQGPVLHSAHWDETIELEGKKVAVIGTGSSAIQIIPSIQPRVSHLTAFMRSPTWISPAVGQDIVAGMTNRSSEAAERPLTHAQHHFTPEEIERFKSDPDYLRIFRKTMENAMNNAVDLFCVGTEKNSTATQFMRAEMERRIGPGNEDLKEKLIPSWPVGCRRLTPGDGYLEALVKPNVDRVFGEIERVSEAGIHTEDGNLHEVDVIVCATGFDVAFVPGFNLQGLNGIKMREEWAKEPNCYLGLSGPNYPNYFVIMGPRGPWGNGPVLGSIETLCDYFITAMTKMQCEHIKALEPKAVPTKHFNEHVDAWHKRSVWAAPCRSWYKMGTTDGKCYVWPGGVLSYLKTIKNPRWEDYEIRYKEGNLWAFLGNGKTQPELDNDFEKLSPYIRNEHIPWEI